MGGWFPGALLREHSGNTGYLSIISLLSPIRSLRPLTELGRVRHPDLLCPLFPLGFIEHLASLDRHTIPPAVPVPHVASESEVRGGLYHIACQHRFGGRRVTGGLLTCD